MVFDYVANAHTTKIQNYCTAKLVNGKMQQLILGRAKPAPRIKPLHILECGDVENFLCDPHEHPLKTAGVTRLCADDVSKALGLDDAKGTFRKKIRQLIMATCRGILAQSRKPMQQHHQQMEMVRPKRLRATRLWPVTVEQTQTAPHARE